MSKVVRGASPGDTWGLCRGTKGPKCWACRPAAQLLRGPSGFLKAVLLNERRQVQILAAWGSPLSWVGGQQGGIERPRPWGGSQGLHCGTPWRQGPRSVNCDVLAAIRGAIMGRAREFVRPSRTPPFGVRRSGGSRWADLFMGVGGGGGGPQSKGTRGARGSGIG